MVRLDEIIIGVPSVPSNCRLAIGGQLPCSSPYNAGFYGGPRMTLLNPKAFSGWSGRRIVSAIVRTCIGLLPATLLAADGGSQSAGGQKAGPTTSARSMDTSFLVDYSQTRGFSCGLPASIDLTPNGD